MSRPSPPVNGPPLTLSSRILRASLPSLPTLTRKSWPGVRVDDDELVAPVAVAAMAIAVVAALVVAAIVVDHDAVEVERRRRGVERDLGRRRDDVAGVDRLGRRRAGGDLLSGQVVDRGPLGVGRVDVAALGDVEVVDERRRAVAALGVERRQQRAAVDVVDLDRPRARAGGVELAALTFRPVADWPAAPRDEDRHRRRGVAELAAVDAAVAGGRDEEEPAALVEGHALGVAVLGLGQRVDVRGPGVVVLGVPGPLVVVAVLAGLVLGPVIVAGLVMAAVSSPASCWPPSCRCCALPLLLPPGPWSAKATVPPPASAATASIATITRKICRTSTLLGRSLLRPVTRGRAERHAPGVTSPVS